MKDESTTDVVDFLIKHCNGAQWDIYAKAMEILRQGFMKKVVADNNGLCICEMDILMSRGCQCDGK